MGSETIDVTPSRVFPPEATSTAIRKVDKKSGLVWFNEPHKRPGRKKGGLNFSTQFKRAVRRFEQDQGKSFMEFVLDACKYEPGVLVATLNKMLPNKVQIGVGPDDIRDVAKQIVDVVCKHVKDPETLDAIARDIAKLDFPTGL